MFKSLKGKWFLPNSKDIKVSGVLHSDSTTGFKLILDAAIHTGKSDFESSWSSPGKVDLILGIVSNRQPITLYNCFETRHSIGGEEGFTSEWTANYIFTNIHAYDKKQLAFTKLKAEIVYLFEWLGQSGIKVNEFPKYGEEIIFRYNQPQPINFPIDTYTIGQLSFMYSYSSPRRQSATIELNQSANLTIETTPNWAISFEEVKDYLSRFLNWLTISVRHSCQPIKINLYHRKLIKKNTTGTPSLLQIELYTYTFFNAQKPEPKSYYDFNFEYTSFGKEMPELLTRWFSLYPDLRIVNHILAESIASENKFDETTFKDVAQALESFHRIRRNNERIPLVDYQQMKQTILGDIQDEGYRKFIADKLNFGNEPTLADRLHSLINELNYIPSLKAIIGGQEIFVRNVKNNRNYYTHYDPSQKKKAFDGAELYELNEKLLALLTVSVLSEVIQDKEFINNWLRNSMRWGHFVREENGNQNI